MKSTRDAHIMHLWKYLILLTIHQFHPVTATIDIQTIKQCCSLGTNHSISGNVCNSLPDPPPEVSKADSVQCLHSIGVCCRRKESELQCQSGEALALAGQDCNSVGGMKKVCCDSCLLGRESISTNPSCADYLGLGSSFTTCCQTALKSSSTIPTTTTSKTTTLTTTTFSATDNLPPFGNLCEVEGICAQICIPMGNSYKCDCNKGYSLMDDKVSCKLDKKNLRGIDRCSLNNPCEQDCLDTGVAVKCSCSEGYQLDIDNTSCKDIDECALGTHECTKEEICVNDDGTYYCEDPSYTDSPIDFNTKCPLGYKFNGEKSLCDDIDECEIKLLCPSFKTCKNTMGSYTCEGETVTCPPGFYYKAATESCNDIDECLTGDNNCNRESQICINTKGNYTCAEKVSSKTCPPGFMKNPYTQLCDDINECEEDIQLCAATEQCINERGSYNCIPKVGRTPPPYTSPVLEITTTRTSYSPTTTTTTTMRPTTTRLLACPRGYTFSRDRRTCVDINECQVGLHSCAETQRCDNTIGSYHCIRMAGCGTGYTYNYANEICEDDDECLLGTHNCGRPGSGFKCRNTLGSFRCDPVRRPKPIITTTARTTRRPTYHDVSTELTIISGQRKNCLPGYRMNNEGNCEDIDECENNPCGRGETCSNLQGTFQCINKIQCRAGYDLNETGDACEDVDECVRGTHKCSPTQICRNGDGYYTCVCPLGHHLNPQTNQCDDIDECKYYKVCYQNANCVNTIGSYKCECKEGFKDTGKGCVDVNECAQPQPLCEHKCVNTWGSYRCACKAGFTLNVDNRTCSDIDECERFKDKKLCIGPCENIPGSYRCTCPNGYRLGQDGRTCQDIDECLRRVCHNHNDICVNTRGSYKCYTINCPSNYIRDLQHKSRCKKPPTLCDERDLACLLKPEQYTYHFITIVSDLPIRNGHINLITIQGPRFSTARTEFNFRIVNTVCPPAVPRINDNFFKMDVQNYNSMMLYLIRSITGPQEVELEIQMKLFDKNQLTMSAISRLFIIVTEYPY